MAHKLLSCIFFLISRERADPVVGENIYVVAVLAVLLYNFESWVWTFNVRNTICGFHHCACQGLADKKLRRQQKETYKYCPTNKAMMEVCKVCLSEYILQGEEKILAYIEKKPIYQLCREAVSNPETPTRTKFWWNQDLSYWIDSAKDGCPEARVINSFPGIRIPHDSV